MNRTCVGLLVLLPFIAASTTLTAAPDKRLLGEIDFFGYKGLDTAAVRAALPLHEGDPFPPPKVHVADLKAQITRAVTQVIGREPTDVALICCDSKQNAMVFIGLPGESYRELTFNPVPTGSVRFPRSAVKLSDDLGAAWEKAVMNGRATEDDSQGYTLTNDPKARQTELAMREYALQHEELIFQVLTLSSDAEHRGIAAQMLGYGRQSNQQVDALVHASLDADAGVRNNAERALEVLAGAKPEVARQVPAEPFIRLLRSGSWLDHNKASLVLVALTTTRDPQLLAQLRADALDPLLEMGQWRSVGHAEAALMILGRMAGIAEATLEKLIESGQASTILKKFGTRPSARVVRPPRARHEVFSSLPGCRSAGRAPSWSPCARALTSASTPRPDRCVWRLGSDATPRSRRRA
jgi:hypothetical protein